jgi:bisphosphoglycerate-independent phosphoglycerate mutase (AlkP superfamily)
MPCMNDINKNEPDFICLNFANTDMVGPYRRVFQPP